MNSAQILNAGIKRTNTFSCQDNEKIQKANFEVCRSSSVGRSLELREYCRLGFWCFTYSGLVGGYYTPFFISSVGYLHPSLPVLEIPLSYLIFF